VRFFRDSFHVGEGELLLARLGVVREDAAGGADLDDFGAVLADFAPAPANDSSVISINVEMSGTIVSPDELHIAGKIEGNVRASSITIRASGTIKGDVVAETVIVYGRVEGRIYGQKVELRSGANVLGDIMHGALGIDTDATFEGASKRNANALSEAPVFSAKAA
jgi:cytoskeletal protein CcmA (bactofilin family)